MLLSVLPWLACGLPQNGEPFRIGIVSETQFTGSRTTVRGADLAILELEGSGGIEIAGERRTIELVVAKAESSPEDAARAALMLINQEGVSALIGPNRSVNAIPVAKAAENARVPMIAPGSTHPATTSGRRFAFRGVFLDTDQAWALARFAHRDLGARSAALLYDDADDYNRNLAQLFRQELEKLGAEIVGEQTYVTGESDFRPALRALAALEPELVFLPNFGRDVSLQLRQISELGLSFAILGSDSWDIDTVGLDHDLEGIYFSHHWHLETALRNPAGKHFVEAYRQRYDEIPQGVAALAYDTVNWLARAATLAGSDEPEAIREALANLDDYVGATGLLSFRGRGGDPLRQVLILEIRGGRLLLARQVIPSLEAIRPEGDKWAAEVDE